MNDQYLVTADGLKELKNELDNRINKKRKELTDIIEDMKEKGDISENEGLSLAREEYSLNETRINELEKLIAKAVVTKDSTKHKVGLGDKVKVIVNNETKSYELVGEDQANPLENKISYKSPLGIALMGKKTGDKVIVQSPSGKIEYKIVDSD